MGDAAAQIAAAPHVLELPDVYHLASDLTGTMRSDATSLRLAAALHEAQESDTSSLRALRLYAGQWAERPDDPLNLG